jgi:hypothetical protein
LPGNQISALNGVRFGQDGLAYIIPGSSGSSQQPSKIFLLRGPFVLPAEAMTNSAPTLTSASQSTITVGGGNVNLTLTGTGFIPGATAFWSGAARTTTFVDRTHVQVAIPASDLASAKTITMTVQNPGSGDSNSVSVQVQ